MTTVGASGVGSWPATTGAAAGGVSAVTVLTAVGDCSGAVSSMLLGGVSARDDVAVLAPSLPSLASLLPPRPRPPALFSSGRGLLTLRSDAGLRDPSARRGVLLPLGGPTHISST